jgi:hypothetical protein
MNRYDIINEDFEKSRSVQEKSAEPMELSDGEAARVTYDEIQLAAKKFMQGITICPVCGCETRRDNTVPEEFRDLCSNKSCWEFILPPAIKDKYFKDQDRYAHFKDTSP